LYTDIRHTFSFRRQHAPANLNSNGRPQPQPSPMTSGHARSVNSS